MTLSPRTRLVVWRMRLRGRAFVACAEYRIGRAERLRAAGRHREADRTVGAVRRELRRHEAYLASI